jgi:hypothetical protein
MRRKKFRKRPLDAACVSGSRTPASGSGISAPRFLAARIAEQGY